MWIEFWGLRRDPFGADSPTYVATAGHDEAIARLTHAAEAGHRSIGLAAPAGLGKSTILGRALAGLRGPGRKVALARSPLDGADLYGQLAAALGLAGPASNRQVAWRRLSEAARLCRLQGIDVVLAVDDTQVLDDPADRRDLERLDGLLPAGDSGLTVIRVGREGPSSDAGSGWGLRVRLGPLTLSESRHYIAEKVESARGRPETFSPGAVSELHRLSGGVPRGLDRLATLALMAGAVRGLEVVSTTCVAESARECLVPATA